MTDFMVITFDPNGSVQAMHRDQFNLGFLGKQQIERASEIFFNEVSQAWGVMLPREVEGRRIFDQTCDAANGFADYNDARAFEVEWLERCALEGLDPMTYGGIGIARDIRAAWSNRVRIG